MVDGMAIPVRPVYPHGPLCLTKLPEEQESASTFFSSRASCFFQNYINKKEPCQAHWDDRVPVAGERQTHDL